MDDARNSLDRPRLCSVGDLRVDLEAGIVSRDGQELALPELSLRLLLALLKQAPNRVSKDDLIAEVWQGGVVSDETLTQRVRLLRQALGDSLKQPRYIASVRSFGYRLVAPVVADSDIPLPRAVTPTSRIRWLVAAVLLLCLVAGLAYSRWTPEPSATQLHSLAVLPLSNLGADDEHDYLVDGIHHELISRLSRIGGLSVISRTSVLPFAGSDLKISEIAQQLDVEHVVEGNVQFNGDQLRVNLQLVDGSNNRSEWSQTFERDFSMEELFEIQSTVAENIALALQLELSGADRQQLVRLPTIDLANYDRYLLGRHHVYQLTQSDLAIAVDLLEQVVAVDPQYAEAWSTLGRAYGFQASGYADTPPSEAYPKALQAAQRALQLDSQLADAHSIHADVLAWFAWDWASAEDEYQKTLALDPANSAGYALFNSVLLRHERATALMESLTSRYPSNGFFRINAAWRYFSARQYQRALAEAALSQGQSDALAVRGWALLELGRSAEAIAVFEQDLVIRPNTPATQSNLAVALVRAGQVEAAMPLLEQLRDTAELRYVPATAIAAVYFAMKDADQGFQWLQRAKVERDRGIIFLQVDHAYDGYRDDQRYKQLITEMQFPP